MDSMRFTMKFVHQKYSRPGGSETLFIANASADGRFVRRFRALFAREKQTAPSSLLDSSDTLLHATH